VTIKDTRVVRSVRPGCFAVVMGTGIMSVALLQAAQIQLSAVLLAIAVTSFAVLAVASAWRAAAFPADLRADVNRPGRAFTCFAVVAGCNVLADRIADDGHRFTAAALAAVALLAWLGLTWLVPGRLAARPRRVAVTDISGSWYLWAVATQSLAIAAAFLRSTGIIPPQPAALASGVAWWAGVLLYLVITAAVAARLLLARPGPQDPTAPYWVAMGAASITVLAAAQILDMPGAPAAGISRAELVALAVGFWAFATSLIPLLAARGAWRHLRGQARPRYRADWWMIVFPAGMYATASIQLGTAAGQPAIRDIGTGATWLAACAWTLTFTAMIVTLSSRLWTRA
jgi:tellurite resistance protein TehA-like permease